VDAAWPLPRWVAHRGAGTRAPENTLAAFRLGTSFGYRAFECDVKLSADGVPFLLHDATLERTTDGQGRAADLPWSALSQLDAGRWHGPAWAGEPPPTLATIAAFVRAGGHALDLEIKPTPGHEAETGRRVALAVQHLWAGAPLPPLLSSFRPETLLAAREAAPALPRALLLDTLWDGWAEVAHTLGCVGVITNHLVMDAALMDTLRAAGWRAACYTVNEPADVERLLALGVHSVITDAVDRYTPAPG
jgi:glycerophosphoryl diester phosphodiesterase